MKGRKNDVICIIGMHRSGTSMVGRILHLCGLDLGPPEQLLEPDESNPLGYFENENFTYKIDDPLLVHLGGSWDNPPRLKEGWEHDSSLIEFVNEAKSLIKTFSKSSQWGWKDPRATLLLPFWKSLIPNLRFVICVRSPLEVAKSLAKRDRTPIQKGVYLWNHYMRAAIKDTEGCPRIFAFYEDFFKDGSGEINRLVEFCRLRKPDDVAGLQEAISRELKHHTSETLELLNEDEVITEYKLFYIGLRALTTEGFVPSTSDRTREALTSENISKFFKLLEQFHDEQEMAQLQSALADKKEQITNFSITMQVQQKALAEKEQQVIQLTEERERLAQETTQLQARVKSQEETTEQWGELMSQMEFEKERLYHFWLTANNSLGWRLMAKCHSLEDKLMPLGTLRRTIYDMFWNSQKTIIFRGWSTFVQEAKNKLKVLKSSSIVAVKSKVSILKNSFTDKEVNNNITSNYFNVTDPKERGCILVIDRFVPEYDKDSGSLRMYSILGILNEIGYKITFLPDDFKKTEPYSSELHQMGIDVLYGKIKIEKYLETMGQIFTSVIVSRPEIAFKYVPLIRAYCIQSRIIYDTVDLHWLRFERAASVTGKEELRNKAKRYKLMELFNAKHTDVIFTVTNDEKEHLLREIPELKIEVIPNIHDVIKIDNPFKKRKDIMFIGGFLHSPNEDAVFYFIKEIFPMVKEKIADIRFFIVGSNPSDDILNLNSKDILVKGYVKDVMPYFKNCRVFVSPLRYGAGMKGKIGQSMAYGLPVVSTKIGGEGMGLVNAENALIADEPKEFADAVVRLYRDESLWNKISIQSIEHIERTCSKDAISIKLAEIFHSIKQQKPQDEVTLKIGKKTEVG